MWLFALSVARWPSLISSAVNRDYAASYSTTTHTILLASCTVVCVVFFLLLQHRVCYLWEACAHIKENATKNLFTIYSAGFINDNATGCIYSILSNCLCHGGLNYTTSLVTFWEIVPNLVYYTLLPNSNSSAHNALTCPVNVLDFKLLAEKASTRPFINHFIKIFTKQKGLRIAELKENLVERERDCWRLGGRL